MTALQLDRASIHRGELVLVNGRHSWQENPPVPLVCFWQGRGDVLLCPAAADALNRLMEQVGGWGGILPVSGWRPLQEQQKIWDDSLNEHGLEFTRTYVAVPGHSEHQTGLAIDLVLNSGDVDFLCPDFPYTGICQTFREQAARYGFVERYPKGREAVTGIGHEPWHFRYVGLPHAQVMDERGLVLEEYISWLRQFPYGEKACILRQGTRQWSIAFLKAEGAQTALQREPGMVYALSGNNVDGWIVTWWREGQ